ncbi:MAG: hypothetical protein P8Y64_10115 [Gammaproteobacteria bacterium]|jgi:hypothetical protein
MIEALFSPRLILAASLYLALSLAALVLLEKLGERVAEVRVTHFLLAHMGVPLVRVLLMLLFILLTLPVLLDQPQLPGLGHLLDNGHERFQTLVNWLFVVSLILPLLPAIGRFTALILPIQGTLALAFLAHWAAADNALKLNLWPDLPTLGGIVLFAVLGHRVSALLAHRLGLDVRHQLHIADADEVIGQTTLLVFQIPSLLLYGLYLGRQFTALQ